MTAHKTFDQLMTQGYINGSVQVNRLLGSAWDNANDTVYLEKARPEDEWEEMAWTTLQLLLCEATDEQGEALSPETKAWFKGHGIEG